ncbi:lasso peptide biosynthesis B2 protein [Pelagerythrobacter aerophilus]|uniref:Lasso peptide biosynthesis B2 protein n=1 Tax=Pelagerythrobacter aerophilus TaxID=2306995 RepID=A0A418NKS3_9SPHN|nr:lasso peptide biosynthesis B2 protein [Pelagerythrobacter aerophilus]RIV80234.1 lasso peptide biosynthesis B2 protein [Pelagerythrobacter aerophilus]
MEDSLAWCECDGRLVFLDVRADRYLQLSSDREMAFRQALDSPEEQRRHQPSMFPLRAAWRTPRHASRAIGAFNLADIAAAIWWQRRVERRLISGSLYQTLLALRDAQRRVATGVQSSEKRDRTLRAFQHARVLRTAADRCLPRSIALALRLARDGLAAQLVIGVRTNPFGAHSWAQHEDEVLNDSVEEVLRFTPILIV